MEQTKSLSELEHFFQSICKTVENFTTIQQAKLKMDITNMVSTIQIENYKKLEVQNVIIFEESQSFFDDANQN